MTHVALSYVTLTMTYHFPSVGHHVSPSLMHSSTNFRFIPYNTPPDLRKPGAQHSSILLVPDPVA